MLDKAKSPNKFDHLYAAWKHAKGTWEAQSYSPEYFWDGLPDEVDALLCSQTCDALNAFLLHPTDTIRELAIKLRVFRDEEIADGWARASEIVATIASDAHRLAFEGR